MEFKLYCFAQSGNAFKAALMLNLCGAKWEPRFVDFFGGETRTAEYRASINEMGEVPVLEHRGKRLAQSGVILHHLADHFGKFQGSDRQEVLRWIPWDNHKLTSYIATLRFLVQFQKTGETPVTEFLRGRIKGSLGISWSDYPRIGAWLERIRKLPGWVYPYELMPGHPLKR